MSSPLALTMLVLMWWLYMRRIYAMVSYTLCSLNHILLLLLSLYSAGEIKLASTLQQTESKMRQLELELAAESARLRAKVGRHINYARKLKTNVLMAGGICSASDG